MNKQISGLVRRQTPEEKELAAKQTELAALQEELAQRELDLATLQAELRRFEGQYLRVVGARYAELDELNARIAEVRARSKPNDAEALRHAREARAQAEETARQAGEGEKEGLKPKFQPSEDTKKLYKEAVKRFHPDATTDPAEKERRHGVMVELNAAYAAGDVERMRDILRTWESSPDAVPGADVAAELIRAIRRIAQSRERLEAIDARMADLCQSDLWKLKEQVNEAEQGGRDLLEEMAAELAGRIATAQLELETLLGKQV